MLAKGLGLAGQVGVLGDFPLGGGAASFRLHPCPATSPDHTPGKGWRDGNQKKSAARERDLTSTAVSGNNDDHVVGPPKRMLATYRRMLLLALALGAAGSLTSVNLPLTVMEGLLMISINNNM